MLTVLAAAGLVAGTLLGAGAVLAEPGNGDVFELDASLDPSNGSPPKAAVTDNAAAGEPDDWDRICHTFTITNDTTNSIPNQCVSAGNDNANSRSFDSETTATGTANAQTIFTGGGSKDKLPLSGWASKDQLGGLPDKDNLLHAMAARYNDTNSYIFFGADRFDNSGDAQIGFWFFKTTVCVKPDGSFGNTLTGTTCSGTAVHSAGETPHNSTDPTKQGDILILSDFTNGGVQPTIRIFEYVGSNQSGGTPVQTSTDGTLNQIGGGDTENRDCAVVTADDFCASVNNFDGAVAPWLFKNKSGQSTFGHGEFYEGGLNLNTLGLQNECFASFLAETRSSQSVTATLKDFVLGGFEACASGTETTPSAGSDGSVSIGTGSVSVTDTAVVTVSGATGFGGTVSFHLCGPTPLTDANYTLCTTGGTAVPNDKSVSGASPVTVTSDAATITSAGRYCWRADYTGDASKGVPASSDSRVSECFKVTPVTPALDTAAVASPVNLGSPVQDNATLLGTATQPGSPIINPTVVGAPAGGTIQFTLLKADCTTLATGTGTNPQSVTVSGDGTYGPVSFTPDATGTYHWKAQYIPALTDPNNIGSTHNGSCDDPDEAVVVQNFPTSITTRQFVYPQDKATVTVGGGGDLDGSLNFRLYNTSANCLANVATPAGGLLYEELGTAHVIAGASPQSAKTNNTTVAVTTNTTVFWRVTYTSNKGSQPGSSSACVESTQVTYVGNDGTITVP